MSQKIWVGNVQCIKIDNDWHYIARRLENGAELLHHPILIDKQEHKEIIAFLDSKAESWGK